MSEKTNIPPYVANFQLKLGVICGIIKNNIHIYGEDVSYADYRFFGKKRKTVS